jgi:hypothetical protein
MQSLVEGIRVGEQHYNGPRPVVQTLALREGGSEKQRVNASYFRSAIEMKMEKGQNEVIADFDSLKIANAYLNTDLDPKALYHLRPVIENGKKAPKKDGVYRAEGLEVHRLLADGTDSAVARLLPDFLTSNDFPDSYKKVVLRSIVAASDPDKYIARPSIDMVLHLFPFEIKDGKNCKELMAKMLKEKNKNMMLNGFEAQVEFIRQMITQLDKYGGCNPQSLKKITEYFHRSSLWRRNDLRGPIGREDTKWLRSVYFN